MRDSQSQSHYKRGIRCESGLRGSSPSPYCPRAVETDGQNNGFDVKNKAIVLYDTIRNLIARGATTHTIITNLQNLGVKCETAQQAGFPSTGVYNSDFTFSPRLGVAYAPFSTKMGMVFRGGYDLCLRRHHRSCGAYGRLCFRGHWTL